MSFSPDSEIQNNENLFRAIRPDSMYWREPYTKVSSAAFKSKNGLSVDRDGGRTDKQIKKDFKQRDFEGILASATAKKCRDCKTHPIPKPSKNNPYHAEIYGDESLNPITEAQAKLLSRIFEVVCEIE